MKGQNKTPTLQLQMTSEKVLKHSVALILQYIQLLKGHVQKLGGRTHWPRINKKTRCPFDDLIRKATTQNTLHQHDH